jgi:Ran GTPase-activating protein (RanGAP) involved in mRNA processing and transport
MLQALAERPTLTMLGLRYYSLDHDEASLLKLALCNLLSFQCLVLESNLLGTTGLAKLAPALYRNTSIKVLALPSNVLNNMQSAEILRDILRSNKTMTALDVSGSTFGLTTGAVKCIAVGLGRISTLLKLNLSKCGLRDRGLSSLVRTLAQTLGSRDTTLPKLTLANNSITHTGVGVLLETTEQISHDITDLDLGDNRIGNEGAGRLVKALANNRLPNLVHLSFSDCGSGDDGLITLVSALKQNTSLLQLDLRYNSTTVSERTFLAFADSLPEIEVLQRIDFDWGTGLRSAMPRLLVGLHKNTSLLRLHVANCAPTLAPPRPHDTAKCAGGWMQEKERLGHRNRFLLLIRSPKERPPPRGVWPHALARAAAYPGVIFEVLCCNPSLVPTSKPNSVPSAERLPERLPSPALAWVATLNDVIFEVQSQPKLLPSKDTESEEAAKDTDIP